MFLGIDLGTSGARASGIDAQGKELAFAETALEAPISGGRYRRQNPLVWKTAVFDVIQQLGQNLDLKEVQALAIDATSSSVLLTDAQGTPLCDALMYNDQSSQAQAAQIRGQAPAECAAHGASSTLAKVMQLLAQHANAAHICHQADWIASLFSGQWGISDENNCLKLGFDPVKRGWPDWLEALGIKKPLLPRAYPAGTVVGTIQADIANLLGLAANCLVIAGTTDSVAATLASGASEPGDAVTSLGSTLVLKLISEQPLFAPEYGIYSHRLGERWLLGGASNSGGRVLLQHFSQPQLDQMTPELDPEQLTGLDYYPLPAVGERFPRNDPGFAGSMSPRPKDDTRFFQALLEGIANIEAEGYRKLVELGAPRPTKIFSCGGGNRNPAWSKIRQQKLGVAVINPQHTAASYGAALLARQGYSAK